MGGSLFLAGVEGGSVEGRFGLVVQEREVGVEICDWRDIVLESFDLGR